MNTDRDEPRQIREDFLTWVRQNEAAGMEWFLAEGAPAAAETSARLVTGLRFEGRPERNDVRKALARPE